MQNGKDGPDISNNSEIDEIDELVYVSEKTVNLGPKRQIEAQ